MPEQKPSVPMLSLSLVAGLVAAIGALLFLAWLANEIPEGELRHFDDGTRAAVHQFASPFLTSSMLGISFLGSTLFLTGLTVVVVLCFALRRWKREAILFGVTMVGAASLDVTLKNVFHRARPVPFFDIVAPKSYSFPSGHALASFCFYGALAAILTTRIKKRKAQVVMWTISAVLVFLIGLSRVYLGVHYTTDVLAGFAAALIWIMTVGFVEQRLASRRRKKTLTEKNGSG
jgi:membrane-associated phospholipid phosphatase